MNVYYLGNDKGLCKVTNPLTGDHGVRFYASYEAGALALIEGLDAGTIKPELNVYVRQATVEQIAKALHAGEQIAVDKSMLELLREDLLKLGIRLPSIETIPPEHPHVMFRLPPTAIKSSS